MKKYLLSIVLSAALIAPSIVAAQQYVYYSTSGATATNASTTVSGCINLTTNLRYLDTDSTTAGGVTKLQSFLYSNKYLSVQPTGYFGTMTRDAVTKFQTDQGLVANPPAFVGPQTRAKISALTCGSSTTGTTSTTTSTPTDCKAGDLYSIRTGLRCDATTSTTGTFTNTTVATTTATTTPITTAAPTILPYMRILSIIPLQTQASTTRDVYMTWEAESMTTLDIALINNSTRNVIVIASSTPNDQNQTMLLSSSVIPDGSYSMMIYWPVNHLAYATSPIGTVSVTSRMISVNRYPAATTSQTTDTSYSTQAQAVNNYVANAEENKKAIAAGKKKVAAAKTAEEKQSALQELCAGWKFFLDPADCTFIKLTGI